MLRIARSFAYDGLEFITESPKNFTAIGSKTTNLQLFRHFEGQFEELF